MLNDFNIIDEYRTSAELEQAHKSDDLINIYTDYRHQTKLEGRAKLIERKSKGLTFMLHNEPLFTRLEDRAIDHESGAHYALSREQKESNFQYVKLKTLLTGVKKSGVHHVDYNLYKLYNLLRKMVVGKHKKVNKGLEVPRLLHAKLEEYKIKWKDCTDARSKLFNEYSMITIIRFIQQYCIPKWCYSIWREESWLVEFEQDYYGGTPFRTIRKIRTLICISPAEESQTSDIFYYTTQEETSISNADKKDARELKKAQTSTISDELDTLPMEEWEDSAEETLEKILENKDALYYKVEEDDEEEEIEDIYQSKRIISLDTLTLEELYDEEDEDY